MPYKYLADAADLHAAWQAYTAQPNVQIDPYAHPDYLLLNQWIERGQPGVIAGEGLWYPFVMRDIPDRFQLKAKDITSPYGFGGPLGTIGNFQSFWQDFCKEHNVVAEFIRFNPLLNNHVDLDCEKHHVKDVVWFDLMLDQDALEANLHAQKRRYLKKQTFTFSDDFKYLDDFIRLYEDSMTEKQADEFYHFPRELFTHLKVETCWVHSAIHEGEVISAALFLYDGQTVQYFLGANNETGKTLKSSAWLLWQTALKAKASGHKRYMLGGGMQRDDSLFRFKQQLSCLTLPYWIGRQIHNPTYYQQIIDIAQSKYPGWYTETAPLFFYRETPPGTP